jgi:hypothetical protein
MMGFKAIQVPTPQPDVNQPKTFVALRLTASNPAVKNIFGQL